jgi:RimJ/RimL family protein N-acetyltransferase
MALLPDALAAGPLDLHRWRQDYLDQLLEAVAASFPELHRWMPWAATMPTASELTVVLHEGEADFDADRDWPFVLVERASEEVVGSAGLHRRAGPGTVEIGYWVRSDRTGRGYATWAARSLSEAAYRFVPDLERVEIRMDAANGASAAVPPKLGFRLLGAEERDVLTPGHTGQGLVWALDRPGPGST